MNHSYATHLTIFSIHSFLKSIEVSWAGNSATQKTKERQSNVLLHD